MTTDCYERGHTPNRMGAVEPVCVKCKQPLQRVILSEEER